MSTDATYRRDLAVIHSIKNRAIKAGALDESGYRAMIGGIMDALGMNEAVRPSSASLPPRGRYMLMDELRKAAGEDPEQGLRYRVPGKPGWITATQAGYIARLEDRLGWRDRKRLLGFIERQTGAMKAVPMLSNREASDVITGLERLAGMKPHPRSKVRKPSRKQ